MVTVMQISWLRSLSLIVIAGFTCGSLCSQTVVKPSSKIEPGLERAVDWKWRVAPAETKEWGMPLPEALRPKPLAAAEKATPALPRPASYEVKKGDALIKIVRKFDMTAAQLKQFNDLQDDRIHIGQVLRIPTLEQLLTLIPPPPPPKAEGVGKPETDPPADPGFDADFEARMELENVRLQVFLDREQFSPGMIDGKGGATFEKISGIYQQSHPEAANPGMLKAKAEANVKQPYTTYLLRADDFKFIKPSKVEPVVTQKKKKTLKVEKAPPPTPVTIDDLVAADFLGYTSPWEFVAERFHCDEEFLHRINPQLKSEPAVGAEFQVPNVTPFEIEKALDSPLQPTADPAKPVTAAVVLLTRLEISQDGKLIAVMPLTTARPGLRGRDKWTVLDAIPQPRLATKREPREAPKPKPPTVGDAIPSPEPVIEPPLETEQYLAPGPNNPIGILWINLAKSGTTDPLPYGLHGTRIPARMKLEGIGGLRLTNWDIARAVRLMPAGTPLQWKAK
jgi:LysM repeat protein